jgi:hypothetical protein
MDVTQMNLLQSEGLAMKRKSTLNTGWLICGGLIALSMVGCQNKVDEVPGPVPESFPKVEQLTAQAPAGLPVPSQPPTAFDTLVASTTVTPRPDPFAQQLIEQQYEIKARNERVFQQSGQFWPSLFIPKVPAIIVDQLEPQPFRRLAGVLVGDSVMAIIDMGDNQGMQVIRPGMQIANSPWKVISIDEEKAILRRDGNKRPKEIVVRLQGPQSGTFQNSNPGFGQQNPGFGQNPGQLPPANPGRGGGKFGSGGGRGRAGGGGIS